MLLWAVIVVVGAFFVSCTALYFLQTQLVFHPTREFAASPSELGIPFEDVYLHVTQEHCIHGWYFASRGPDSGEKRPVVLFCHGNAGNISHRLETAEFILSLGADVLLYDYRGYGKSDGFPSEENVYADAETCYNWLIEEKKADPQHIFIFGRSLGGAVAIELARRVKCGGLIVESSFTSVSGMAKKMFPLITIKHLLKHKFDSIAKIGSLTCPVLVTHSPDDDLVPFEMGRRLFAAANEPKWFVALRGGHNDRGYLADSTYMGTLYDLIHVRLGPLR